MQGFAALHPLQAGATSTSKAGFPWVGGVGPVEGTLQVPSGAAQPLAAVRSGACEAVLRKQSALTHVSSVAASMRLTPPQPDPPRLRQISAICRKYLGVRSVFRRKTDLTPEFHSISDRCVDQGRHLPTAAGICRRWGGVAVQDRWRHGWRHRAPRTGLRRVLHSHTAPPSHGKPAFAFVVEVAGQRPALPRVQGCKPCKNTPSLHPAVDLAVGERPQLCLHQPPLRIEQHAVGQQALVLPSCTLASRGPGVSITIG